MNIKKHVAVYVPHGSLPDKRGFAPAIVALKLAMGLKNWQKTFFSARNDNEVSFEQIEGIDYHRFSVGRVYKRLFQKMTRADPYPLHARLARRLKKSLPSVLHVHQLEFPVQAFRAKGFSALPIVVHAHVTTQRPQSMLADRYIAVSRFVKLKLVEKGFPEAKITVLSNGVDTDLFAPLNDVDKARFRELHGFSATAPILLFFGRKQLVKGFDIFLNVAESLMMAHPDLRVLAIGPEPDDSKRASGFNERAKQRARLAATGHYMEMGPIPHEGLAKWIAASDVALLPSRSEPQGMAMLEAMAAGCLTVSCAVGGIKESIRDGVTGWLLSPDAPLAEWTSLVSHVLAQRASLQHVSATAIAHVHQEHDWEKLSLQLECIYDELLLEKSTT